MKGLVTDSHARNRISTALSSPDISFASQPGFSKPNTAYKPPNPTRNKPQINSLTGIRAVLILWVVLFHLQPEISALFPSELFFSQPLRHFASAGFLGVDFSLS